MRVVGILFCLVGFALCFGNPPQHAPAFSDSYYATSADVCTRVQLPNCPADFVSGQILSQIFYDYTTLRAMALDNYNSTVSKLNYISHKNY